MNKQNLLNVAGRFLDPQKQKTLSQAFDFANQITNLTTNPKEAFEKAGVTLETVKKAKEMINNPVGAFVVQMLGGNKSTVVAGLERAEQMLTNNTGAEQAPANELDELQASLARLQNRA